jgi:hypothetical protein
MEKGEMGGHVARSGEMKSAYKILVGQPERKRPLGTTRRRWEHNTRMDLRKIAWGIVKWLHVA